MFFYDWLLLLLLSRGDIQPKTVFAYPKDNEKQAKEGLKKLKQAGLQLYPVDNLDELAHLWEIKNKEKEEKQKKAQRSNGQFYLITSLLLILIAAFLFYQSEIPPPPCVGIEKTATALQYCVNQQVVVSNDDLNLDFHYNKYSENFTETYSLKNGDILYNLDQFKIEIIAPQQSAWVSVFNLDRQGKLSLWQHNQQVIKKIFMTCPVIVFLIN